MHQSYLPRHCTCHMNSYESYMNWTAWDFVNAASQFSPVGTHTEFPEFAFKLYCASRAQLCGCVLHPKEVENTRWVSYHTWHVMNISHHSLVWHSTHGPSRVTPQQRVTLHTFVSSFHSNWFACQLFGKQNWRNVSQKVHGSINNNHTHGHARMMCWIYAYWANSDAKRILFAVFHICLPHKHDC